MDIIIIFIIAAAVVVVISENNRELNRNCDQIIIAIIIITIT